MLGLYIHVPFCSAICNYCNFNRGLFDADLKRRYVEALLSEIRESAIANTHPPSAIAISHQPSAIDGVGGGAADTIYFGGGTPSLLEPDEIAGIIAACAAAFDVAADREVTLEANPETVSEARLAAYRAAGVNRLSFGVQSFRDEELRRLSRLHSADRARAALGEARAAGFDNVSLDLMMWLPQQAVNEWLESVDAAIALAPEHLSLYLLEVYPNAPLRDDMARARWSQAPDEDAVAMYVEAMARLEAAGLEQYEISNVARAGRRSRHNLKYWTDGEWLGFGCGAHSTRGAVRWKNISSTVDYIETVARGAPPAVDLHRMTPDEQLGDALFTGLRLVDGIDTEAIERRYGVDVCRRFGADLQPFLDGGWLRQEGSRLWLTRQGMLLAHEVMAVFV
ncbi:MAG TPA: radical SAM family heme chaperone HemW [Vicinamibacterales bacterium]|nr:radical SAM family heme chaperone HemW [Vicinamibacterales bacterium]